MPLLADIRKFFARKRSVAVIDLTPPALNGSDESIHESPLALASDSDDSDQSPDVPTVIPEFKRDQPNIAALLNDLRDDLDDQARRHERMIETMETLKQTSVHQNDVLGLLQQQLDDNARTHARILDATAGIPAMLSEVIETTKRCSETMSGIAEDAHEREARLTSSLRRFQYWMIGAAALSAAAAITALILALVAINN